MVETKRRSSPPEPSSSGEAVTAKSSTPERPNAESVGQGGPQANCDYPFRDEAIRTAAGSDLDVATGIIVGIVLSLIVWGGVLTCLWLVTRLLTR